MSEIKFRGITAEGFMVYGQLSQDRPGSTLYYNEYSQRIIIGCTNYPVSNETLSQYTGITDSNDKEIYYRDIVKTVALDNDYHQRGAQMLLTVRSFMGNTCVCLGCSDSGVTLYPFNISHWIEVIGNIDENPELLEKI